HTLKRSILHPDWYDRYLHIYKTTDEVHLWDSDVEFVSIFLTYLISKTQDEREQECYNKSNSTKPVHSTSIIKRCYFIQNRLRNSLACRWGCEIPLAPTVRCGNARSKS